LRQETKMENLWSRKTLKFLIARSIYMSGIKPSLFFTKPFEAAFKRLPDDLIEKFGLDAEKLFMKHNLKTKRNNGEHICTVTVPN
jgi:hypothetical protein